MYNTSEAIFSFSNLLFLARASISTCDFIFTGDPPGELDLGPSWQRIFGMVHLERLQPQVSVFYDGRANLVVTIGGIGSFADFNEAMNGSFDLRRDPKLPGLWNNFTLVWLERVLLLLSSIPSVNYETIAVVGHSFGGTVACAVGYQFALQRRANRIGVFTCGAPRFCDSSASRALSTVPIYRLMNWGDVVPAVPPRPLDAPLVYPLLNPSQLASWLQLVHPDGGVLIDGSGNFAPSVNPGGYSSPLNFDLRTGWTLYQNGGLPAHSMTHYAQQLGVVAESQTFARVHGVPPTAPMESPIPASERKVVELQQRQHLAQLHANQTRVPASETAAFVKVVRRQRRWFVEVNGKPFYTATSKRDARGVARATRMFLKQYWQQPTLFADPAALIREADAV